MLICCRAPTPWVIRYLICAASLKYKHYDAGRFYNLFAIRGICALSHGSGDSGKTDNNLYATSYAMTALFQSSNCKFCNIL